MREKLSSKVLYTGQEGDTHGQGAQSQSYKGQRAALTHWKGSHGCSFTLGPGQRLLRCRGLEPLKCLPLSLHAQPTAGLDFCHQGPGFPSARGMGATYQGAGRGLAHLGQDTGFSTGRCENPEDRKEQGEDRQHAVHLGERTRQALSSCEPGEGRVGPGHGAAPGWKKSTIWEPGEAGKEELRGRGLGGPWAADSDRQQRRMVSSPAAGGVCTARR